MNDPTAQVTAEAIDALGTVWRFRDKLAIFRVGSDDGIRCTLQRIGRHDSQLAYWVSTALPDAVRAVGSGETEFVVPEARFSSQLGLHEAQLLRVPRASGLIDIDVLQHAIAIALGVLPPNTSFSDAKPLYWTAADAVGDFTLEVIRLLVSRGELVEDRDDATLLRWVSRGAGSTGVS